MGLFKKIIKIINLRYYELTHQFLSRTKISIVKCPICNWIGTEFIDFDCGYGHIFKKSTCPICRSQPRHRSFYLYLKKVIPKNRTINVLHFAPERFLTGLFKSYNSINYLSIDINKKKAMKKEDITNLSFKDNSFEIIFCSHVLEHVIEDKKAMMELYRVLSKNGFAIIDVPINYNKENTYEDFSITSPEERTKAYWQHNHVRLYGRDFPDKLRSTGFNVRTDNYIKTLGLKKVKRYGLMESPIYFCTKA